MELLLPHNQRTRAQIDEVLDLELIEQQAEHGTLDFQRYATFVVDKMAAMCAPVRDKLISSLRGVTDVVTLYRYASLYGTGVFYLRHLKIIVDSSLNCQYDVHLLIFMLREIKTVGKLTANDG